MVKENSQRQSPLRIAYLIMVHKDPTQFERLFRAIYHQKNFYLVHVDRKSPQEVHSSVAAFLTNYPNARLMKRRWVTYTGFSQVGVGLQAIRDFLQWSEEWNFFINLSGQDFPLKTQREIISYLKDYRGKNFIHVGDPEKGWPESLIRIRHIYLQLANRVVRTPIRRRFLEGVRPFSGSSWFILSRDFCEYVVGDPQVLPLKRFYRYTLCPDEGFFQTAIANSRFRSSVMNDNKRMIEMLPTGRPRIFLSKDLPKLISSRAFFARKFDSKLDEEVLDRLERKLRVPGGRSNQDIKDENSTHS